MSLQALWEPTNLTMFSSVFTVPEGMSCVLTAHNFRRKRFRSSAQEIKGPQVACVRRILFGFNPEKEVGEAGHNQCEYIYTLPQSGVEKLTDQPVTTENGVWQLSTCRNLAIIGLPGIYRLELNDATVVGDAQVYAEWRKSSSIPLHMQPLYFL